jgi:hypothetical protein
MNKLLLRSVAIAFVLLYSNLFAQLQPVQNIPINGTSYVYGSSTYIAWYFNGYEAGLTVELQVSTNSDMSSPFVDVTGLTGLTYEVTGLTEGTTYYWRVRSKSSGGAYSAWTGIWSFTVSGYGGGTTTPLKPVLNVPLDGSTVTSSTTWLAWYLNGSHAGLTYHVQVSTASNFGTFFVKDSGLTDLTYGLSGLVDGETYYWRVRLMLILAEAVGELHLQLFMPQQTERRISVITQLCTGTLLAVLSAMICKLVETAPLPA